MQLSHCAGLKMRVETQEKQCPNKKGPPSKLPSLHQSLACSLVPGLSSLLMLSLLLYHPLQPWCIISFSLTRARTEASCKPKNALICITHGCVYTTGPDKNRAFRGFLHGALPIYIGVFKIREVEGNQKTREGGVGRKWQNRKSNSRYITKTRGLALIVAETLWHCMTNSTYAPSVKSTHARTLKFSNGLPMSFAASSPEQFGGSISWTCSDICPSRPALAYNHPATFGQLVASGNATDVLKNVTKWCK